MKNELGTEKHINFSNYILINRKIHPVEILQIFTKVSLLKFFFTEDSIRNASIFTNIFF